MNIFMNFCKKKKNNYFYISTNILFIIFTYVLRDPKIYFQIIFQDVLVIIGKK